MKNFVLKALKRRVRLKEIIEDENGAATAEYVVVIMAGVIFAGILIAVIRGGEVQSMLLDLVQKAFSAAG